MLNQKTALCAAFIAFTSLVVVGYWQYHACENNPALYCLASTTPPQNTVPSLVSTGKNGVPACQLCHGDKGQGNWAAGFPRLAGLNARYMVKQLQDFARDKTNTAAKVAPIASDFTETPRAYKDLSIYSPRTRADEVMSDIAKQLSPEDIQQISQYYARLAFKAKPQSADFQILSRGRDLALIGKPQYQLPRCSACHGPKGEGFGHIFPPLSGQPPQYIIQQINRWQQGKRDNDHLAMMKNVAKLLSDEDKANIAAYYNNLNYQTNGG